MDDGLFGCHVLQERRKTYRRDGGKKVSGVEEVISINLYSFNGEGVTSMPIEVWISLDDGQDFGVHLTRELMSDFYDLSAFGPNDSDLPEDLLRIFKRMQVQPVPAHPSYEQFDEDPENFSILKACRALGPFYRFETVSQVGLITLLSIISLVNYDWTVEREPGVIVDSVKSVNTSGIAKDQYKQVKLNLPKSKQVLDFFKQKQRTRKFGTAEHVVRGHWRHYKRTGERVWIDEHTRGDSEYGTVHKDYLLTKRENFLKQTA
jgi:hypothetical protein